MIEIDWGDGNRTVIPDMPPHVIPGPVIVDCTDCCKCDNQSNLIVLLLDQLHLKVDALASDKVKQEKWEKRKISFLEKLSCTH